MTVRGERVPLTRAQIVSRALSQVTAIPPAPRGAPADAGRRPIHYRLDYPNGGDDPHAVGCWAWAYGDRTPVADCVGFALWAIGIDRRQPGYRGVSGEWLHCPSILDDAARGRVYFEPVRLGEHLPGDLLVTPAHVGVVIASPRDRSHLRGAVVRAACTWTVDGRAVSIPAKRWTLSEMSAPTVVVDCSPAHRVGEAPLGVGIRAAWSPDARPVRLRGLGSLSTTVAAMVNVNTIAAIAVLAALSSL